MNKSSISPMMLIQAGKLVFEYGIEPLEEHFCEFTDTQYLAFRQTYPDFDSNLRLYSWIPPQHSYKSREVLTLTEEQRDALIGVAARIKYHGQESGRSFESYADKLHYSASIFPPYLSEGTPFAIRPDIKCVK